MKTFVLFFAIYVLFISPLAIAQNYAWQTTTGPLIGRVIDVDVAHDGTWYTLFPKDRIYSTRSGDPFWRIVSPPSPPWTYGISKLVCNNAGALYTMSNAVHKSTTGGATWDLIWEPKAVNYELWAYDIAAYGWSDFYCGTESRDPMNMEPIYKIVYSRSGGSKWDERITGWFNYKFSINELGTLYAFRFGEIIKTENPNSDWTIFSSEPESTYHDIQFINGRYPLIRSTRTDEAFLYTVDDGASWRELPHLPPGHSLHCFTLLENNTVVAAYRWEGFTRISSLAYQDSAWHEMLILPMEVSQIDPIDQERILFGTQHAGLFEFNLTSRKLKNILNGYTTGTILTVFVHSNGTVFAADDYHCIYAREKGASIWQRAATFVPDKQQSFVESTSGAVFVNGYGVLKSSDNGLTWDTVLVTDDARLLSVSSWGTVYAATSDGVFFTSNEGLTWTELPLPDSLRYRAEQFIILPNHELRLCTTDGLLYSSHNAGAVWERISMPGNVLRMVTGPQSALYALVENGPLLRAVYPETKFDYVYDDTTHVTDIAFLEDGTIYLATLRGVVFSRNNGATWFPHDTDLPETDVFAITASNAGYIYAGLRGYGVYKAPTHLVSAPPIPEPASFTLSPAYPNPVSRYAVASLEVSVARAGDFQMAFYNEAGMLVREWSKTLYPGTHALTLNTRGLVPGAYRLSVRSGEGQDSEWVVVR